VTFYQRVFGWEIHVASDEPEFRYTTLGEGHQQRAGRGARRTGVPF